ncbi:Rad52/22 double-strand break repair protein [Penicillium chermesinum]|uniref:RAD52 homolog n=1 Tax=Penicillium chermesinum TaxID=63820 RepID=A0A9W9P629_9EURO|nr:Rad52/22 double-strand break repair protein [Penicillium chermesinum]KAJ5238529.1 Rad52/22 double-strand break repair protein [Penicillium chermesinum]
MTPNMDYKNKKDQKTDQISQSVGDQHRGGPATIGMPNAPSAAAANPFEEPQRRMSEYTAQEIATLQSRLDKKLGPEYISARPGAGGQKVHYLSADKCINLANEVFGFNGWSSSIQKIDIDFIEESQTTGKISLGLSVIVRIILRDGTFHEDIGYGHIENCKGKAAAFEKAKKEGTTDALKRTLRTFGNVLGNCVYDKDYLSKVIKVKAAPARWDVEALHRHRDYAPVKKEPAPSKSIPEDDDLPPRPGAPVEPAKSIQNSTGSFDGDGEFGSDLFDEADFVVSATGGNPDEISIDPEPPRAQPPTPMNNPAAHRGPAAGRFDPNVVTPSKPERWNGQNGQTSNAPVPVKREPPSGLNQDSIPPSASQTVGFYSARVADSLRDNPNAAPAPGSQFDPHADSPSIRKTAGVDHTKSVPISRPMLAGASPAPNSSSRDFMNPATDLQRRVGAPGGPAGGAGSPLSRGPSTSSYRPLTRPNVDQRSVSNPTPMNGGSVPPQNNPNGKRPPLNDVTNATAEPSPPGVPRSMGPNETKRPRVSDVAPEQPPPQPQK